MSASTLSLSGDRESEESTCTVISDAAAKAS